MAEDFYWQAKRLEEMSLQEWERLCDGCGKCCLEKLENPDTGELAFTNVACRFLDLETCRCAHYDERLRYALDCVPLAHDNVGELRWMPSTCAYRLLAEGKDLPDWHPLKTGDSASVARAGQSVRGRAISEKLVGDLEDHIVDWSA